MRFFRMLLLAVVASLATGVNAGSKLDSLDLNHLYGYIIANHLGSIGSNLRWPDAALPEGAPFCVGVFGRDPFGDTLEKFFADKKLKGRPLAIVRSSDPGVLTGCQLIFADRPTQAALKKLAAATVGKPVATVVFSPDSVVEGGMIELFLMTDGGLRFTLDIDRIRRAQLVPSPGLLQLALHAPPR